MCLGCQAMKPKKELIRIVKNQDGDISVDLIGKKRDEGLIYVIVPNAWKKRKKLRDWKGLSKHPLKRKYTTN
jgi:predicted RNA-binding protein YlxR (DUF448 family)